MWAEQESREQLLAKDQTIRLIPGREGVVFRVRQGCLLVTQVGDPRDHVVEDGEELRLAGRGTVVAWALALSSLHIGGSAADARSAPVKGIRRWGWGLRF